MKKISTKKNNIVRFTKLTFHVGTGNKSVQLKFLASIEVKSLVNNEVQSILIESTPSENFIVMTNTKQWNEAQGVLIKDELFKGKMVNISKHLFCNCLQKHYIDSTKQTLDCPSRPLWKSEFSFLFSRKLGKSFDENITISQKDFDSFWNWFGPVLQKIRYHKHLLPLWNQGLIWGIIDKKEAEKQLKEYGAGTFLIRFSEGQAGSLAIAYKQRRDYCRHYLIKNSDTNGQGKSLINFIKDAMPLLQFLRVVNYGNEKGVSTLDKYQALENIGSKVKKPPNSFFYDEQLFLLSDELGSMNLS